MILFLSSCSCVPGRESPVPETARPDQQERILLPAPRLSSERSLEETLSRRRSVRRFTDEELTPQEISQLLWAVQGITREWGGRTAPSAGALYPLEVYVAMPRGFYHYVPQGHKLEIITRNDLRAEIWEASLKQDAVRDAPAVFIIAAVYERTAVKYGDRAARYVHLEAGHAAQNLLLQAVALDLGGVPIGAFHDDRLQSALSLPGDHEPLYVIPIGHPAE
ncbi:MAG: SagB/ThcOx family dehydrogenase [Anaerolineae bacterium]|nr:SagB/ThcOx family dehydrogenase [Anaerolineae bacterium]